MRIIPLIIGAISVLAVGLLGLVIYLVVSAGGSDQSGYEPVFDPNVAGTSVDSAARIELEVLRQQMDAMQSKLAELETQIARVDARVGAGSAGTAPQDDQLAALIPRDGPNQIIDAYAQVVLIANRRKVNKALEVASPSFLEAALGRPREVLSDRCESITNAKMSALLVLEEVGPIRVQMLQPAVDSLKRVFENVRNTDPDLYARINTAGSLCVRQIRGSNGRTSSHSFGLAVDLNIDGHLDTLGDGKTQLGLTILADFFITEGWFWGAGFGREDSMHFEVSRQMIDQWVAEGKI
ncbi:MAG: M15 family metallopeptidase [Paracoccaceae bacterium]